MRTSRSILLIVFFAMMLTCASIPTVTADVQRQLWAVVVGVEGGGATHLDNDAQDFADVLTSIYGYPSENIRLLTNSAATKSAVINALNWLADQEEKPDGVTIFFSAHGAGNKIKLYNDEQFWDYELASILSEFESHNMLVIINACLSGNFLDVADVIDIGILLTACSADESTYDISLFANTIFVEYFLESLSGYVSVQTAFDYAYANCADPPGALTPTHPQMVDKYGEGYILSSPVHAPWFSNFMAVMAVTVLGYAIYKKKINFSSESTLNN